MSIWATDDPTGIHASERPVFVPTPDEPHYEDCACDGPCGCGLDEGDDIERADLDAATRADAWIDEQGSSDFEAEADWPF